MLDWIKEKQVEIRANIAAGRTDLVERRYMPAVLGVGVVLGCIISTLFAPAVVIVFSAFGFAVGYGVRAYISVKKRERFYRNRSL